MTSPGRNRLDQIVRGLDGVTAGEWHTGCLGSGSTCQCSYVLSETYMGAIASVHVGNGLPIGEGGNDAPPADEAAANMRHIARCSPDAIREIALYVAETEARATAAEATVAALGEALKPFAIEADKWPDGGAPDDYQVKITLATKTVRSVFTVGDLRRARKALTNHTGE